MPGPAYLTSFVGRQREVRELQRLLRESRLVTLVGPGGAGKTRLATELFNAQGGRWPDGSWWVDLTDVARSDGVAGAIVSAMELPGRGAAAEVISAWLASRRALLVLDNCEQVAEAAADVAQVLLQRCPGLTMLATSREPLGLSGEVRWPVEPLDRAEALLLFERRARLVRPAFELNASNREDVAGICRRVDDLPLAIELAASRMAALTAPEVLANLDRSPALLSGGDRATPARQRTMTATIDWSYRLLDDDEATLFRRLSVFHGGFDLEAAAAVCGADLSAPPLEVLTALVDKSMVHHETADGVTSRYRLLEPQRHFAAERLESEGEGDDIRRRHFEHFSARVFSMTNPWLAREVPGDVLADQLWRRREAANLGAALEWGRNHPGDAALRLAIEIFSTHVGDVSAGTATLVELAEASRVEATTLSNAYGLVAWLAVERGDLDAALPFAETALEIAEGADWDFGAAMSRNIVGIYHQHNGDFEEAARQYDLSLKALDESKNPRAYISILNSIGIVAGLRGDRARAVEILQRCLDQVRSSADTWLLAAILDSQCHPLIALGEVDRAEVNWRESLGLARDLDDYYSVLGCIEGLARVASIRGDDARALRLAGAAARIARVWSTSNDRWAHERFEAAVRQSRDRLDAQSAGNAWRQGEAMTDAEAIQNALEDAQPPAATPGPLSPREVEVLRLVARGFTNREMAQALFLSERGAEGHVERIRNKLGVRSRTEAAAWAIKHGLVEAPPEKEKGTLAGPPSRTRRQPSR